jgi:hypothetical protein
MIIKFEKMASKNFVLPASAGSPNFKNTQVPGCCAQYLPHTEVPKWLTQKPIQLFPHNWLDTTQELDWSPTEVPHYPVECQVSFDCLSPQWDWHGMKQVLEAVKLPSPEILKPKHCSYTEENLRRQEHEANISEGEIAGNYIIYMNGGKKPIINCEDLD